MEQVSLDKNRIVRRCKVCGYEEAIRHAHQRIAFVSPALMQKKKWAADDNTRELIQPMNGDGTPNDDFSEAYQFNPADPQLAMLTPKVHGGPNDGRDPNIITTNK